MKRILLSACLLLGGLAVVATASRADFVDDREAAMKQVRRGYRTLLDMARSDSFDAATAQDNAAQIRDALAKFKDLFPDGSQDADKWALPEIWSDCAGFERARQAADQAAADLAAVTAAEAYKPAFANLAAACKSCHDKFVRKED